MVYVFFGILGLLLCRGKNSIAQLLFVVLIITSLCAYLVGRQIVYNDIDSFLYQLYTGVLLFILFRSFRGYANCSTIDVSTINYSKLIKLDKYLRPAAFFAIIVSVYVIYKIIPLLVLQEINVQEYKNEGGAADVINMYVPHIFITFSNIFSVIGYFFLSMHFFYLSKGNMKQALICLILSLSIILNRLVGLSRSSTVEYVITYSIMFIYFYPLFKHKIKAKYIIIVGVVLAIFGGIFSTISESRFSGYYTKNSRNNAILDESENPTLFSLVDYMSQWVEVNNSVLERYSSDNLTYGAYGFSGLTSWFSKKIDPTGKSRIETERKVDASLGELASSFCGLISLLTVDFGYIGTFIFIVLFSVIIRNLSPPKSGAINMKTVLWLPVLVNVTGMFWSGNNFIILSVELAIIYTFFWIFIISKKKLLIKM